MDDFHPKKKVYSRGWVGATAVLVRKLEKRRDYATEPKKLNKNFDSVFESIETTVCLQIKIIILAK